MKHRDWSAIMRAHPVFAILREEQREELLHAEVSAEITYEAGETIVRQGELGRSVFLMGEGSAAVMARQGGSDEVELYSVGQGELFGDMALIEERPRAASVRANEITKVLEINGVAFVGLLKSEPEIAFMLLGKLSRRLRFANAKVMEQRIAGLDETVTVMNSRVDSMLAKTDAHLIASKVIFDQTKQSANEVVEAGERKQALLTRVGTIGAVILTIAASFGFWDMKNTAASFDEQSDAIAQRITKIDAQIASLDSVRAEVERKTQEELASLDSIRTEAEDKIQALKVEISQAQALRSEAQTTLASTKDRLEGFNSRISAQFLLSELNQKALDAATTSSLSFTKQQIEEIGNLVNRYNEDEIEELRTVLTSFLSDGLQFHKTLGDVLDNPALTNPKGEVFLNYFAGLSAIQDQDEPKLFGNYRRGLEEFTAQKDASLNRALLVTNDDRSLLHFVLTAQVDDESETAHRVRKVDLLVDQMQGFASGE